MASQIKHGPLSVCPCARCEVLSSPALYRPERALFPRQLCPLLVGACIAGPPTIRGQILGSAGTANAGRASPAPTAKSRNSAYNYTHFSRFIVGVGLCSTRRALQDHMALADEQCSTIRRNTEMQGFLRGPESFARRGLHRRPANGTGADFRVSRHGKRGQGKPCPYCETTKCAKFHAHSFAVHSRGGALLHPKSLAGSQGLSRRAMLAPTIESQKIDIFLRKPCPLLVGACIAGPPTVRPAFGTPAAHLSGRKHFPITKKDPQVYRLQVFHLGAPSAGAFRKQCGALFLATELPRANQHRTVVLVAACGRPPCSRPWCKPKNSPRS